jgi:hypothetical protein
MLEDGIISWGLEATGVGPLEQPAAKTAHPQNSKKVLMPMNRPSGGAWRRQGADRLAQAAGRQEVFAVQSLPGEEIKAVPTGAGVTRGFVGG